MVLELFKLAPVQARLAVIISPGYNMIPSGEGNPLKIPVERIPSTVINARNQVWHLEKKKKYLFSKQHTKNAYPRSFSFMH